MLPINRFWFSTDLTTLLIAVNHSFFLSSICRECFLSIVTDINQHRLDMQIKDDTNRVHVYYLVVGLQYCSHIEFKMRFYSYLDLPILNPSVSIHKSRQNAFSYNTLVLYILHVHASVSVDFDSKSQSLTFSRIKLYNLLLLCKPENLQW